MRTAARLLKLLAVLQEGSGLPAQALAARCGVSLRTIHRDLGALLRLGFPLRFDNGYRLAAPELLAPVQFTPEEALAARLALAGGAEPAAKAAEAKLTALGDLVRVPPARAAGPQLPLDLLPVADAAETARLAELHRAVNERLHLIGPYARCVDCLAGRLHRPLMERIAWLPPAPLDDA